ncbi:MAG: glycosyltransferase family 2 protein [Anaerolineae bacterium]|nr:glycosyltransferase family 2 protein [Anaerolineae bacterium]
MPPQVTVIILNWNGQHFLAPCLDAVLAQTFRDFALIVVDNGSTDGSIEFMRDRYPQLQLIANERNLGFAAGNNQAIRASRSEFVVLLNNDTEVEPGWLAALVRAATDDERVGICASKMLFAHRRNVINSAGILVDRAGIAWDRQGGQIDNPQEREWEPVFGACAGAALYRRAMLDEIGLFDEDFFAYLEDADLAWRAQWAGWQARYVPQARVYHHHSGTAREGSPFKNHLLGRNKIWMIAKNYPLLPWYLPVIVSYDVAAVAYTLLRNRDASPLQGRLASLRGIPAMLRKRRMIQRRRRVKGREILRRLEPLSSPWRIPERYDHLQGLAG